MHSIKLLEVSDVYLRLHLLQEHRWSGAKKAEVSESDAILGWIGSGGSRFHKCHKPDPFIGFHFKERVQEAMQS